MKKLLLFLCVMLLVFVVIPPASASTILTSDVWSFNGHEYYVIEFANQSWESATSDMNFLDDVHLATITSQEEQNFIAGLLGGLEGEYWLGGYQDDYYTGQESDEDWNWVTGEDWVYTNWGPLEPNDSYGVGTEQYLGTWQANWIWNDEWNVDNIAGYIAESVPEPGTMLLLGSGLIGLGFLGRKKLFKK